MRGFYCKDCGGRGWVKGYAPCPSCGGVGYIESQVPKQLLEAISCPYCEGTGRILTDGILVPCPLCYGRPIKIIDGLRFYDFYLQGEPYVTPLA